MKRRLLNMIIAGVGLLILGPFILLIALVISLESKGSPLFRQRRIGKEERQFTCYKLRTMTLDTPSVATHLVDACQVTRLGRILRKTRLDEVPQLWNVLVGDMDIVGPRPCLPSQETLIDERRREGVFAVRPGITGLAQVQGLDMSTPERLAKVDGLYVKTVSLKQDLAIILATVSKYHAGYPAAQTMEQGR